ncbi:MAG: SpaH/EbpB family LPXTG-anchored major pilin [Lachnospiraceae bacterium]|nr:SpaH/EbpB family LPXTG-anchored major pilin [Lachnospiraceae bacterium]
MRWIKKFAVITSMVSLLAGSCVVAQAQETVDITKKCSLTIYEYDATAAKKGGVNVSSMGSADGTEKKVGDMKNYAIAGVKFTYLKVADFLQTTDPKNVEILYSLDKELAELLELGDPTEITVSGEKRNCYSSDEICAALNERLKASARNTKKDLEEYISEKNGITMSDTDEKGRTRAANLDMGLYLVVETGVPDQVYQTVNPFFVSLPMTNASGDGWIYDVYAYPKNQTDFPTLEQNVRNKTTGGDFSNTASASIGDTLTYRIVSKLPTITTPATFLSEYNIADAAHEQIILGEESVSATLTGKKNVKLEPADYNIVIAQNAMSFSLSSFGLSKVNKGESQNLVIEYSGKLSQAPIAGDSGMLSTASLTYKRTNSSYSETIGDGAKVYSYGIRITITHKEAEESTRSVTDEKDKERKKIQDQIRALEKKIKEIEAEEDALSEEENTASKRRDRERRIRELERQIENLTYNEEMLNRSTYASSKDTTPEFDFTKVKFTLKNEKTGKYMTVTGKTGTYTVTGSSDTATEFSASASGTIDLTGVGAGSYELSETATSDEYALLEAPVKIQIDATEDKISGYGVGYTKSETGNTVAPTKMAVSVSNSKGASATVNEAAVGMLESNSSANAIVPVAVENLSEELVAELALTEEELRKKGLLPQTGERGIYYMTYVGIALALCGCLILLSLKKSRKK